MHLRFYTWLDRSGGVMPGENKQYPARPNAWYCIWTYLNLDILSTFLFWFRFKHRRGQFQVLVKMDRLINLWSIWALSAPSLDLRSFGPAILDYGWIMDGLWMDYGWIYGIWPSKNDPRYIGSHILTAICVESRFEGVECHTGLLNFISQGWFRWKGTIRFRYII